MPKFVFLDTMIYLHFKPIEEIDWPSLLEADEVHILVPKITTSELDKHKDNHPKSKVRDRARSILHLLESTGETGPHELRKGVTLQRFTRRPRFDLAAYDLDPNRNDDQLIASALEFREGQSGAEVFIISGDATARLTAKDVGLRAMTLPAEYQIRNNVDPEEEEVRQLRAELARLKQAYPKLSLRFQDGEDHNRRHVALSPIRDVEAYVQSELAKVKAKYPPLDANSPKAAGYLDIEILGGSGPSSGEFARYNSERRPYFDAYAQHLHETGNLLVQKSLSLPVSLEVANDGTAVATDLDVFAYFPDGIKVWEQSDWDVRLKQLPTPPRPPRKPRSAFEIMRESIASAQFRPATPDFSFMQHLASREPPNLRGPQIEDSSNCVVSWNIGRAKHKQIEQLHTLVVVFESTKTVRSFKIEYVLHAANLPDEVAGELHVIVQS
jgi:hypothetical protein